MNSEAPRCPGCDAELGPRRHCLECDIELIAAPDEPSGWLALLRGKLTREPDGEARTVELELAGGRRRAVELGRVHWLPEGEEPRAGDAVELLVTRLQVFGGGGLREAPQQQEKLVARAALCGADAGALMRRELERRLDRQAPEPDERPELLWPRGFRVNPRPGRDGWRLRLRIRGKWWSVPATGLPLLMVLAYSAMCLPKNPELWPVWLGAAAAVVVVLLGLVLTRSRTVVLDAHHLSLQYGPLPFFRRRVARTEEITGLYPGAEDDGCYVTVLTSGEGGSDRLVWGLGDGAVALLTVRLLETALGLTEHRPWPDEERFDYRRRLPDLERMLRPMREEPEQIETLDTANIDVKDLPRGTRVLRGPRHGKQRLELDVTESGIGSWSFLPLVLGGLWLLVTRSELFTRPMPFALIDGLACVLALVGVYVLVAAWTNHTRIVLTPDALRLRSRPLPWVRARRFPRSLISYLDTDCDHVGKGVWVYQVDAHLRDGRRVALVKGLTEDKAKWLLDTLARAMRLQKG